MIRSAKLLKCTSRKLCFCYSNWQNDRSHTRCDSFKIITLIQCNVQQPSQISSPLWNPYVCHHVQNDQHWTLFTVSWIYYTCQQPVYLRTIWLSPHPLIRHQTVSGLFWTQNLNAFWLFLDVLHVLSISTPLVIYCNIWRKNNGAAHHSSLTWRRLETWW
jgi:hypothetical protein